MDQALLISALLLGLAGSPHCLAMCGAACTAVSGGGRWQALLPFHLGRLAAYTAAGAVAAGSVGSLAALGQAVSALRPLWTLVHMAALGLGLFLLWQGRQPAWMARLGTARSGPAVGRPGGGWQAMKGPVRSAGAGLAWVAWPCGLLQSALLVAALANSAAAGAAVMAGFGLASAAGLVLGPAIWAHWLLPGGGRVAAPAGPAREEAVPWGRQAGASASRLAVRSAGAALALASAWALGHGLWTRVAAWCLA